MAAPDQSPKITKPLVTREPSIHGPRYQWRGSPLEGAAGIFERVGMTTLAAEVAEMAVRDLHAKIRELAVANDLSS